MCVRVMSMLYYMVSTFVHVQVYVHDVTGVCVRVYVLIIQRMRKCVCSDPKGRIEISVDQNTCSTSSPPAHPSVKRVPGLALGSKVHWLCLTDH